MPIDGSIESTSTATSSTAVSKPGVNVASGAVSALGVGSGAIGLLGIGAQSAFKLPMTNPLHKYASYDVIYTIAALSPEALANPEKTYLKGGKLPIVLKTAGGQPSNRIKTAYGQFDFYIDELVINSTYGFEQGTGNANVTNMSMTISEPYSMGTLFLTLGTAADKATYKGGFRECIFLLKIEFKGEDNNGNMVSAPNTTKYIPFQIRTVDMEITGSGSIYKLVCIPASQVPLLQSNATITSELTVAGSTVQEILQTGPSSLQSVINERLRSIAFKNNIPVADEILIVFPTEGLQALSSVPGESEKESAGKAADNPKTKLTLDGKLFSTLKVSRSSVNNTLVQTQVNAIGVSDLGYDNSRWGKTPAIKPQTVYEQDGSVSTNRISKNPKISEYGFPQGTSIQNAINQTLMTSKWATDAIKAKSDMFGYRTWCRIETQIYHIDTDQNLNKTGRKPTLSVYRVLPYKVHETTMPVPGSKSSKYKMLLKQCVKVYNYLYTGKNQDILKFNLLFNNKFVTAFTSDMGNNTADAITNSANSSAREKPADVKAPTGGPLRSILNGIGNYQSVYSATKTNQDRRGSGGEETPEIRIARQYHDAVTYGRDLNSAEMEIVGDPYYLTGNGMGNYSSPPTDWYNLTQDASVNYQNGEVDIALFFRTPIDINPSTGLYNMAGTRVGQFSGIFKLQKIVSRFSNGQFTQTLTLNRRQIDPTDEKEVIVGLETAPRPPEGVKPPPATLAANGVNAQGQNVTINNADGSTVNPETSTRTPSKINGFQ